MGQGGPTHAARRPFHYPSSSTSWPESLQLPYVLNHLHSEVQQVSSSPADDLLERKNLSDVRKTADGAAFHISGTFLLIGGASLLLQTRKRCQTQARLWHVMFSVVEIERQTFFSYHSVRIKENKWIFEGSIMSTIFNSHKEIHFSDIEYNKILYNVWV